MEFIDTRPITCRGWMPTWRDGNCLWLLHWCRNPGIDLYLGNGHGGAIRLANWTMANHAYGPLPAAAYARSRTGGTISLETQ